MKRKVDQDKLDLLKKILGTMPEDLRKTLLSECEVIGLCERVSYHKVWCKEETPYTHVHENETILLWHKRLNMILIYGPKIEYRKGYIEN